VNGTEILSNHLFSFVRLPSSPPTPTKLVGATLARDLLTPVQDARNHGDAFLVKAYGR